MVSAVLLLLQWIHTTDGCKNTGAYGREQALTFHARLSLTASGALQRIPAADPRLSLP